MYARGRRAVKRRGANGDATLNVTNIRPSAIGGPERPFRMISAFLRLADIKRDWDLPIRLVEVVVAQAAGLEAERI